MLSDKFAVPTRPERLNDLRAHIATALNTVNAKTGERDQIRFAARDADRAMTRVLEGNWDRSQEWSRGQGQQQERPHEQKQEMQQERQQERQLEKPERQLKAPARAQARGKVLERA
jgi:hypothetical protein